ncbi:hypothetical protein GCM10022275_15520 [Tessaracoccus defluvii]
MDDAGAVGAVECDDELLHGRNASGLRVAASQPPAPTLWPSRGDFRGHFRGFVPGSHRRTLNVRGYDAMERRVERLLHDRSNT